MINVLIYGVSGNRGGIETYYKKIIDNIDKSQYHFTFLDLTGSTGNPAFKEEFEAYGCDFVKVCPRNISIRQNRKDLAKLFNERKFDVLHYSAITLSYIAPIQYALKNGCRVVLHAHGSTPNGWSLSRLLHTINQYRVKCLELTRVAVSPPAGEWFFGKNKYTLLPNGVDTSMFRFSQEKREQIRKSLGCEDKLVVASVAAFLPVKNHTMTINVFEQVHKRNSNAVLWLIGEGPTMENVKQLVTEKGLDSAVKFLGRRTDMPELYCGMDFHILPSFHEGFPNVAMEAQAMGVPCLFSDTITKTIKVTDKVEFLSLTDSPSLWATKALNMLNTSTENRANSFKEVEQKGMSVEDEVIRISMVYSGKIG